MMEKDSSKAQEPGVVVNATANVSSGASASSNSDVDASKTHQFNEQTNYVPKSTIITVSQLLPWPCSVSFMLTILDLPCLRECRPLSIDGPNHPRDKFIHHRKSIRINRSGIMDCKRILHVKCALALTAIFNFLIGHQNIHSGTIALRPTL